MRCVRVMDPPWRPDRAAVVSPGSTAAINSGQPLCLPPVGCFRSGCAVGCGVMKLRRLALDAGIVLILVAATVAYLREPNSWTYFSVGEKDLLKFGGAALWHAELIR